MSETTSLEVRGYVEIRLNFDAEVEEEIPCILKIRHGPSQVTEGCGPDQPGVSTQYEYVLVFGADKK